MVDIFYNAMHASQLVLLYMMVGTVIPIPNS